jgi:hypothetical protein
MRRAVTMLPVRCFITTEIKLPGFIDFVQPAKALCCLWLIYSPSPTCWHIVP